ncbi:hypothetical protein PQR37_30190 [Paraburkholderia nemoris]|uniref:hypothetical protein n=1 Tax=Paraburkholderia TaxID=1822464 RepID=UPI0038B8EB78
MILTSLLVAGCTTPSHDAESRDQAAGILISSNAFRWQDIASSLQPNFQISSTTALQQVAPVTQEAQLANLNANSVSAIIGALAGPTGKSANASPSAVPNPQAVTGIPTGVSLPAAITPNTALGVDPMLQYRAALSLFQYVQELNADLTSSTFTESFVPYVVRLKLTVVPYRQNLPYDLFAKIAFFTPTNCYSDARNQGSNEKGSSGKIKRSSHKDESISKADEISRSKDAEPDSEEHNKCLTELPLVVPLLVTDDIERAATSVAVESARQLALALQILSPYAQGTLAANSVKQNYQALSGQNYDSLLTVGRENDNTLAVRIGAAYQTVSTALRDSDSSQNTRSLVGQNYDISAIVLVPKSYFKTRTDQDLGLLVFVNSDLVNITTGQRLPERPHATVVDRFEEALDDTAPALKNSFWYENTWKAAPLETKYQLANCAVKKVTGDDFLHFLKTFCDWTLATASLGGATSSEAAACATPVSSTSANASKSSKDEVEQEVKECMSADEAQNEARWMWTRLSALTPDSAYFSSSIDLPFVPNIVIPEQKVTLFDDGKTGMQVQLRTNNRSISEKLVASLTMGGANSHEKTIKGKNGATQKIVEKQLFSIPMLSKSSSFDQTTGVLTFQFASAAASGITGIDTAARNTLDVRVQDCDEEIQNHHGSVVSCSKLFEVRPNERNEREGKEFLTYQVEYVAAPGASGPTPGITLASGAKQIAETNGSGTAIVYFPKWGAEDSVVLTFDGASVTGASAGTLSNGQLTLKSAASVTLQLINLVPGVPVTAQAEGKVAGNSTGKTSLVLNVVPMQSAQRSQQ